MSVERKLISVKLTGYLTGEISKQEIYEWALFVAVSRDYEDLVKNDKLAEQILQFLIDINKPQTAKVPAKKIIEYFLSCLEDKKQYSPEDYKNLTDALPFKPGTRTVKTAVDLKKPKPSDGSGQAVVARGKWTKENLIALIAKVYVLLFVGVSLILNLIVIFKTDFLVREGEIAPLPEEVWKDAFPHLFYGITMILALFLKGPKFLFYILFFIAAWGMFFYWYSITVIIYENKWPLYYLVMLSPAVTIPPTMMFFIMLGRLFDHLRRKSC